MNISKLEIVPIRVAFRHEAYNFTAWLESNIDALSERVGLELMVLEREKAVGSFKVDLFCEDRSSSAHVIIENQLEPSDHDHLGKLLTYLVNLEAKSAIWITPEVRPEHQRVIDWLNESTSADYSFYLVQIEAVRIGDSPYAPLFTVLAAPDEQTREIGVTKKELADRHYQRLEFWKGLLNKSKGRTRLLSNISPSTNNYIGVSAGRPGFRIGYNVRMDDASVWLEINAKDTSDGNKAVLGELAAEKEAIERELGVSLLWESKPEQVRAFVYYYITNYGGLASPGTWDSLQEAMIDFMIRFEKVLRPRINQLHV